MAAIASDSPPSLVLVVDDDGLPSLSRWLRRLSGDPVLSASPLSIVDMSCEPETVRTATNAYALHSYAVVPSDETRLQVPTRAALATVFESIATPTFALTMLPRQSRQIPDRLDSLKASLELGRTRIETIGLDVDRPVLLHTPQRRHLGTAAYVHHVLSTVDDLSPVFRDYLGHLTLASGNLHLEAIDAHPHDGEIELFARVAFGRFNFFEPPPWNLWINVVDTDNRVVTSARLTAHRRVDSRGDRRWEDHTARLPIAEIPQGNHRFTVSVDSEFESLRTDRPLRPQQGVLACARTTLMRTPGHQDETARYLVHTTFKARQTWITLQRGLGASAARRWSRTMLRKDLRHMLHGLGSRRLQSARLLRLLTRPFYNKRQIWLIGERSDTAQDNSVHLFRHLRREHPERDVYYVIDKHSPQRSRVAPLGRVVTHSSLRHRLLMLHATVLANSYSLKHMVPRQWDAHEYVRHIAWRVGALRVYLKHGVHDKAYSLKRGTGGYDLFLTVNPRETESVREAAGYREQVVEVGLPRYDALAPTPPSRTVLFMPTWRRYFVPKLFGRSEEAENAFTGSRYERFIGDLLSSDRLTTMLRDHDYRMTFLPHYNLLEQLSAMPIESDRIDLADTNETSIQDLIRGCDAFITDYSSVHFDVAYLGTPLIYSHFDREKYESGHATVSWFDHRRDGFGPVVETLEETLDALEELLERGCVQEDFYAARVDAAFTFRDTQNCARTVEAIEQLIAKNV